MAMPKKYFSEVDKVAAANKIKELVLEIKKESGLTWEEISNRMNNVVYVSEALLKQYASGKKPASDERATNIAKAAHRLNWNGPIVKQLFLEYEFAEALMYGMSLSEFRESNEAFDKISKDAQEEHQKAIKFIIRGCNLLANDFTKNQIIYMTKAIIDDFILDNKKISEDELIYPDSLPYARNRDLISSQFKIHFEIEDD